MIKVIGKNVLVRINKIQQEDGLFIMPRSSSETKVEVVALGDTATVSVVPGDIIITPVNAGPTLVEDNTDHALFILDERVIIGVELQEKERTEPYSVGQALADGTLGSEINNESASE